MEAECIGCRKVKDVNSMQLCEKCQAFEIQHHLDLEKEMEDEFNKRKKPKKEKVIRLCSLCGYSGPAIDSHHIHGRKNSNEVIDVCCNCHREIHIKEGWTL
jgi:hypothetical protein